MPTFLAPENVTKEVAQHVLWHFGDQNLGLQSGDFTTRLMRAISAADLGNREKLRAGFPEHVALYVIVAETVGGLEWLRDLVRPPAPVVVAVELPEQKVRHATQLLVEHIKANRDYADMAPALEDAIGELSRYRLQDFDDVWAELYPYAEKLVRA